MELDGLYTRYVNDLYRYLFSLSHNHYVAEDLVQETFYRAFLHLEGNEVTNIKPWLFKVGYHAFIDDVRKNKKITFKECVEEVMDYSTPESKVLAKDGLNRLLTLIHTLPALEAHTILLCDLHQLKMHEAADVLGLKVNTLKSYIFRGRQKLKLILQEERHS